MNPVPYHRRMPKRITKTWLKRNLACQDEIKKFSEIWPRGCELNPENLRLAAKKGLRIRWLIIRLQDRLETDDVNELYLGRNKGWKITAELLNGGHINCIQAERLDMRCVAEAFVSIVWPGQQKRVPWPRKKKEVVRA